jgi:hypothetical protein
LLNTETQDVFTLQFDARDIAWSWGFLNEGFGMTTVLKKSSKWLWSTPDFVFSTRQAKPKEENHLSTASVHFESNRSRFRKRVTAVGASFSYPFH